MLLLFYISSNLTSYSRRRTLRSPISVVYVRHRRLIHPSLCNLNVSPNLCYRQYSFSITSINNNTPWHFPTTIVIIPPLLFRQLSTNADTRSNDDNSVWIKMCLSPKDVKIYETSAPVDPILSYHKYKRSNCTLTDIKKKAYELFDTIEHLEYYDDAEQHEWRPIDEIPKNEFLQKALKGRILHLRIPEYFDSFVVGDIDDEFNHDNNEFGFDDYNSAGFNLAGNDYDGDGDGDGDDDIHNLHKDQDITNDNANTDSNNRKSSPERLIEKMIRSLLQQLKENGYIRSKIKPLSLHNIRSNDEILTKEWVLRECNKSDKLRSTILRNANSFHHIVQCLHFDFLWKDAK